MPFPPQGIKLTYRELNSEGLNQAIYELSVKVGFSNFKTAYNIAKISRKFKSELAIARESYLKWVKDFALLDESGKFKVAQTPSTACPWEIDPNKKEEFEAKMSEFLKVEVMIPCHPINISDLGSVQLSPLQINNLLPLLDLEEEK
ncbi:MAG TPA: hypothetical protein VFF49_04880 [Thermodesulfobacteriota bacterium]|nr:hypothetical protein [Thermodesulfobacteriota bacterium]